MHLYFAAVEGCMWCDVWRAVDSQHSLGRLTEYFSGYL